MDNLIGTPNQVKAAKQIRADKVLYRQRSIEPAVMELLLRSPTAQKASFWLNNRHLPPDKLFESLMRLENIESME